MFLLILVCQMFVSYKCNRVTCKNKTYKGNMFPWHFQIHSPFEFSQISQTLDLCNDSKAFKWSLLLLVLLINIDFHLHWICKCFSLKQKGGRTHLMSVSVWGEHVCMLLGTIHLNSDPHLKGFFKIEKNRIFFLIGLNVHRSSTDESSAALCDCHWVHFHRYKCRVVIMY